MITRKQYLDGEATHREYYGEILEECGIKGSLIDLERVQCALADGDEHLNTIPLQEWDAVGCSLEMYSGRAIRAALKKRGDFLSQAGLTCLTKEAARRAADADVCPNCGQWQHGVDCLNECKRRGFAG